MKYLSVLLLLLPLHISLPACADWDPELEKREEIARQKAEAEQQAKQRKMYANNIREEMKREGIDTSGKSDDQVIQEFEARNAQQKADMENQRAASINKMRMELGAEADGKSDEEVAHLYADKQRKHAAGIQQQVEANRPALEAGVKDMTGKSMDELMNMSDEELDKLADDMERKYGQ